MGLRLNTLTKNDIYNLSCFLYYDSMNLPAVVFSHFPLHFKRHCVQVGTVAGLMAKNVSKDNLPPEMIREEYANAVRYGGIYHDIGAYLVFNQREMYPDAGERFLREQISGRKNAAAHKVILETVQHCRERYDGQGYPDGLSGEKIPLHASLCAIADTIDDIVTKCRKFSTVPFLTDFAIVKAEQYIQKNAGMFSPEAVRCYMAARAGIRVLYNTWRKTPPFWFNSDIAPLAASIKKTIG